MLSYFRRFQAPPPQPPHSSDPAPLTDDQRILAALSAGPITKGDLSDRVNLPYAKLDPLLASLKSKGAIGTDILYKHGFGCIHYVRRG